MRKGFLLGIIVAMVLTMSFAVSAVAAPNWDITGTWALDYHYTNGANWHDWMATSFDCTTGAFSGNGGYPAGGPYAYAWTISSGTVSGDNVEFYADYTVGATCSFHLIGTVAADGLSMSGSWTDNCDGDRAGEFTATGTAKRVDCDADGYTNIVDCNDNDAAINPGAADAVCNGIDNNCDGNVDEGYVPVESCFLPGVCAAGNVASSCTAGVETACAIGSPTGDDSNCNGIDENCDGTADNNYVPVATDCGLGVCAAKGEKTCVAGVEQDSCIAGQATGPDDNCNGIDENCDGTADNNYVPTPTACGIGACAAAGTTSCVDAKILDSCTPGTPAAETCNNIDDNCNGVVDEGLTRPTACGLGACSGNTGIETCTAGAYGGDTCDPLAGATAEICDGLDNNCNGVIDEGLTPIPTTNQNGLCAGNTQTCNGANGWQDTVGNYIPTGEICDNKDNNCNGVVDEGLTKPADNILGLCSGNTKTCKEGKWFNTFTNYKPKEEKCDNQDNDCDGKVDEGLTQTTHCGLGVCSHNTGVKTCTAGVWADTCNPLAGATPDVCDNKDNDCNGVIDDSPCTAADYCARIGIDSVRDASGMIKCYAADWQQNERAKFPDDCTVKVIDGNWRSLKFACAATPNAN